MLLIGCKLYKLSIKLKNLRKNLNPFQQTICNNKKMKTVSVKRLIIYKNHIFPQAHKPLRSITQYLSLKNPDLDRLKVRKMKQILDDEEKRRIRNQTSVLNEQINLNLQKYYLKYIQPFQNCPDYYRMLFGYANRKLDWISENRTVNEEPFFLTKKQIRAILKQLNQDDEQKSSNFTSNDNNFSKGSKISQKTSQQKEQQSLQKSKILFEVYRQLYPSQKAQVYSLFTKLYRNFLANQQAISQQLLQTNIIHLKPLLYSSPVELYQSKNPESSLKDCQNYLIDHQKQRQNTCLEFTNIIQERYKDIMFIAQKFKIDPAEIRRPLWEQYLDSQKELSFYNLLKHRKQ